VIEDIGTDDQFQEHMWESESENDEEDDDNPELNEDGEMDDADGIHSEVDFEDQHSNDDQEESDDNLPEQDRIDHMMEILEFDETEARQNHRRRRHFQVRRPVVDVVGMGPDGVELRWAESLDNDGDGMDELQVLGRPLTSLRLPHNDDIITHPSLQNDANISSSSNPRNYFSNNGARGSTSRGNILDQLRLNDGENALQILEQMFSRGIPRADRQEFVIAVDRSNNPHAIISNMQGDGQPNLLFGSSRPTRSSNTPSNLNRPTQSEQPAPPDSENDNSKIMLSHTLSFTDDRWKLEAKLLYGNTVNDKAQKFMNALLNILVPPAIEAARVKKEEEENLRKEEERLAKEIEDKMIADLELDRIKVALQLEKDKSEQLLKDQADQNVLSMEESAAESSIAQDLVTPNATAPEERVTILIHGEDVDITGNISILN
jgi:E3 ubiquitin-protein ligase HUWE1